MMTVRHPSGLAVIYKRANHRVEGERTTDLYTKDNGEFIAQIPNECIIEADPADYVLFNGVPV